MPYIGKQPVIGEFVELDALTASATDTYTLTRNSAAYYPETVNNLLVSINGVIQAGSTMSLSGNTLTVGATLSSSDVIDFVRVFGNVGNVVTPTDGSVTEAKIGNGAVTASKLSSGITKNATIDTLSTTVLSGTASGQSITLTGQYFDSAATVKFKKVSDNSLTNATLSVTDEQNASVATTQTYTEGVAHKLVYTNPNGNTFVPTSNITLGLQDIVLYLSDDFGGSGSVASVTGGWTQTQNNSGSSGVASVTADRIRLDISGGASTNQSIGYSLRTTNAITIPAGYNRVEIKFRNVTGAPNFKISSTPVGISGSSMNNNYTAGLNQSFSGSANSTQSVTIDSAIANGTAWYFRFLASGGQFADVDFEITSIRIHAA